MINTKIIYYNVNVWMTGIIVCPQIRLDAKTIKFKNLPKSFPAFDGKPYPEVYQLCVCGANGKLFLAPSRGNCQAVSIICSWWH